jgi:hypothetical protein
MIIEDDHGKNVDHTHYKLMGVPIQVRRSAHKVAHFIASIIPFVPTKHVMSFRKISWKNGGNRMDNNSGHFICIFVELFEKLWCIVDE